MCVKKNKIYLNERGYTLIESIFQLVVVMLFAQLIILIFMWFAQFQAIDKMKDDVNWELFVLDVHIYLENAREFRLVSPTAIRVDTNIKNEQRIFIIEKSEKHIRKKSELGGNEIMLGYVDKAQFSVNGHELLLQVTMKNGATRERVFIVPITRK